MQKIYLHIGTHKTATTTFQNVLEKKVDQNRFNLITPTQYRGTPFDIGWRKRPESLRGIDFESSFLDSRDCIFSEERLLGPPLRRGFYGQKMELSRLIGELTDLNYDVRTLIVVRNTYDFLRSWYLQTVGSGYTQESFIHFLGKSNLTDFSYINLVSILELHAPLTVIPYEMLLEDRFGYCSLLNKWLEQDLLSGDEFTAKNNKSLSSAGLKLILSSKVPDPEDRKNLIKFARENFSSAFPAEVTHKNIEYILRSYFWSINKSFCRERFRQFSAQHYWEGNSDILRSAGK